MPRNGQAGTKPSRLANSSRGIRAQSFLERNLKRLPVLVTLSAVICLTILANLHRSWAPLPWLVGIAAWAYYFWSDQVETPSSPHKLMPFPYAQFLVVLTTASVLRLYKLGDFPLGPYIDEIFNLNNCLDRLHQPFDLFGQTPLITEGWVEITNLYLYFDLLILKLFGVSYWSMKLFSAIPGIIACAAVFLICRLLFDRRVALWTTLLFTFAHWPVRLSRYGWLVSFMVMAFSVTVWLLLSAIQRGRPLYAYFSGIAAGLCLYSYLGSQICLLSLLAFLALECVLRPGRRIFRQAFAFAAGMAIAAYPLLVYYLSKPGALWVRSAEVSVFNNEHPFLVIMVVASNIWRHALMFFTHGATYARDNFPGLPMMDSMTGLLLIVGSATLVRSTKPTFARFIGCTFVLNFAGGVFSFSQEGAPYVYRTAAVMIPAFLIAGVGLQWLTQRVESKVKGHLSPRKVRFVTWFAMLLTMLLNLHIYFGLEPKNIAAMRVMAYELRLIGLEIARDDLPVILAGRDVLDPIEVDRKPGEKYWDTNPPVVLSHGAAKQAVVDFSGRYDPTQTMSYNLKHPSGIYFVEAASLGMNMPPHGPAKVIFKSRDHQIRETVRRNYPDASVRDIRDIRGEPLLTVATLPNHPTIGPGPPPVK